MGGGFDSVGVTTFPASGQFDVALGAMVDYNEKIKPHTFELRLENVETMLSSLP